MTFDDILAVYRASDADRTRALYAELEMFAPRGPVAVKLLQACKASERAKLYRKSQYKHAAYDKKDWAISELCRTLVSIADELGITWGWARDLKAIGFEDVIYIDVPGCGQISFHTSCRRDGPGYTGAWDGIRGGAPDRICRWAEAILEGREATNEGAKDVVPAGTEGTCVESDAGGQPEEKQETLNL